jgi:hypothetical protein
MTGGGVAILVLFDPQQHALGVDIAVLSES